MFNQFRSRKFSQIVQENYLEGVKLYGKKTDGYETLAVFLASDSWSR